MRSIFPRVLAVLGVLLCAQVGLAVAAPKAGLQLDPGFGRGGVVHVKPGIPGRDEAFPSALAGTGDGGFFSLESTSSNSCGRCSDLYLVRYGANGARDRSFGYQPALRGRSYYFEADFAVDAAGRPLVIWKDRKRVVLRRFTPRGKRDPSFGRGGQIALRCGCYPDDVLPLPSGKIVLLAYKDAPRSYKGSIPVFLRLREDGTRDRSFGGDGIVRPRLHGRDSPDRIAATPDGGIVFSGETCCSYESSPYISRLDKHGGIDHRFGRLARRALLALPAKASFVFWEELISHPSGRIDLMGGLEGGEGSFQLRLRRDGSRDTSFAGDGLRRWRWILLGAVGYGRSGLIVDFNRFYSDAFYRVGAKGRLLGRALRLGIGEEEGAPIEAQRGGRFLVFDRGLDAGCRQFCESHVRAYRFRLR